MKFKRTPSIEWSSENNRSRGHTEDAQEPTKTASKLREEFFRSARKVSPFVGVKTAGGGVFLVSTRDRGVGRLLFTKRRRPDVTLVAKAAHALEEVNDPRVKIANRTFVDVGANIGTTFITALHRHGFSRAIALEPAPENYMLLKVNVLLNDLEEQVTAVRTAASDTTGTIQLRLSKGHSDDHAVVVSDAGAAASLEPGEVLAEVPRTTLDQLVADGVIVPEAIGLLWINVQGHESNVLRGGSTLMEQGVPIVVGLNLEQLAPAGGNEAVRELALKYYSHALDLRRAEEKPEPINERWMDDLRGGHAAGAKTTKSSVLLLNAPV